MKSERDLMKTFKNYFKFKNKAPSYTEKREASDATKGNDENIWRWPAKFDAVEPEANAQQKSL